MTSKAEELATFKPMLDQVRLIEVMQEIEWCLANGTMGHRTKSVLGDANAELRRLQARLEFLEKQAIYHRWNIEEDGDDLLICRNEHDKADPCEYVRYTPASRVDALQARVTELEGEGEAVLWQYRWTNPGDNPGVSESELEWKTIEPRSRLQTLEDGIKEIRGHKYNGRPCYEVRALFTRPATALTKEQRERIMEETDTYNNPEDLIDATERAHGITPTETPHG